MLYLSNDTLVAMAFIKKLWAETTPFHHSREKNPTRFALQNALYACNAISGIIWSVMLCDEVPRLTRDGAVYHSFMHRHRMGIDWKNVPELDLSGHEKILDAKKWQKLMKSSIAAMRYAGHLSNSSLYRKINDGWECIDTKTCRKFATTPYDFWLPESVAAKEDQQAWSKEVQQISHASLMERISLQPADDHPLNVAEDDVHKCPNCTRDTCHFLAHNDPTGWFVYYGKCARCGWHSGFKLTLAEAKEAYDQVVTQKTAKK